jgi:hypothetical protein
LPSGNGVSRPFIHSVYAIVTGTSLVADGGGLAVELTSTAFGPG